MTETGFLGTVGYLYPTGRTLGPAVEQLRELHRQAAREGRQADADEFERMAEMFAARTDAQIEETPLAKKAVFAAALALVLVLAVHYLV